MITYPFRIHHLIRFLNFYDTQSLPIDLFMSHYFRLNTALGSKDRGFISESAYAMIRWQSLIDHFCEKPANWEKRYLVYSKDDFNTLSQDETLPSSIRLSFPESLFNLFVKSHGLEKAIELCQICNHPAPTTVRINSLKTTREAMLDLWKDKYNISPCLQSIHGIIFHKKINFFELEEFKNGLFEIQDEGSQLLAELVQAKPGQSVLDYCAGSGGKTLAFAPKMNQKGQIYLHDIRPHILIESRKRLHRAGIQNAQVIDPKAAHLQKLKKSLDWVLVDAPCSGTGTMRRHPDMKWKFDDESLNRLIGQQRSIFEKALSFMRPNGRIVYATCSLLKEENEEQLNHFIKTYQLDIEGEIFQTLPKEGGMDGFFGVVLKRSS